MYSFKIDGELTIYRTRSGIRPFHSGQTRGRFSEAFGYGCWVAVLPGYTTSWKWVDRKNLPLKYSSTHSCHTLPVRSSTPNDKGWINDKNFYKSSINALAYYSDINEDVIEYYAVKQGYSRQIGGANLKITGTLEGNICIEEWKYDPYLLTQTEFVDPLSLYLCFRNKPDERIVFPKVRKWNFPVIGINNRCYCFSFFQPGHLLRK